jgi:tetratricopeptide (TPR) repeat protein
VQNISGPDIQRRASVQALALFGNAVGVDSEQSSGLRGLALLSARSGNPASALALYQQLQRDSTARATDSLMAGEIAYLSDRKEQAFRYWEKIGADQYYFRVGQYFAAHINSSAVQNYTLEERLSLASAAFERVFFINPRRHDALCPAGVVAYLLKDYTEARRLLEAGSATPMFMTADCYTYLGWLRYSSGEISTALQAFERAGDLGNPQGYLAIGRYYRDRGDCQTAETWFRRAAALGDFGQPWVELGICALIGEDDAIAERYLLTALDKEPQNVAAYYYLGDVDLRRGQIDIAYERLQTAVRLSDGDYERIPHFSVYLALGDAFLQRGDCDLALVQYQIASRIHPNSSKAPVTEAMHRLAEYCEPAK